jgi:hypothetical protein
LRLQASTQPGKRFTQALDHLRAAVVEVAAQQVLVRDVERPEHAVQMLRAVVRVQGVAARALQVDGKIGVAQRGGVPPRTMRRVVALVQRGIAHGP